MPATFTASQQQFIDWPMEGSIFVEGPARSGKTTAAIARLEMILDEFPAYQVLVITPQQSLAQPYRDHVNYRSKLNGGFPKITTLSGLLQEMAGIFWPLIKSHFNFTGRSDSPYFLSLETAQYCMARIVEPLLEKGYFGTVKIERNRLYSQIIDNLNKTAIHGLSLQDIAWRLQTSIPDPAILGNAFQQVEECARSFRTFCLNNNLIDYSLLVEIAHSYLFKNELPLDHLAARFKVLLADNIEEDTPFAHSFFEDQLDAFTSATLIYDQNGGFRTFLGADPDTAYALKSQCQAGVEFHDLLEPDPSLHQFRLGLSACIENKNDPDIEYLIPDNIDLTQYRYLPDMLNGVVEKLAEIIANGTPPEKVAILSPYLSDVLKFSLTKKMEAAGIAVRTSRPSRMYFSSSAIKTILTLAKIAHPAWLMPVSHYDFRDSLMRLIPDLDLIRAEQAAKALLGSQQGAPIFRSFDALTNVELQDCITFTIGQKLELLSQWIRDYLVETAFPLDFFIQQLFGEVLSQKDFSLHNDLDAANGIARLIRSIQVFRNFSSSVYGFEEPISGKIYIESIQQGLLPAAFAKIERPNEGVLIAPAYTFLMNNTIADYQFWLDIGSLGWWERLYQPLTNPYVYQTGWTQDLRWNEEREFSVNQSMMAKLINGLLLRCNKGVFASVVQTNEFGAQNSGALLKAFQRLIKRSTRNRGTSN